MKTEKYRYLSEQFTQEDFANMDNSHMYAFYSVPDTGKTTMITRVLQPYLKKNRKKALYLSHRTVINEQNKAAFDNTVIHSRTYQKIEADITNDKPFFKDYDFIICDECHYFVADSAMNGQTFISFDFVNNSNAVVILLSGTPECLEAIKEHWKRPIVQLADIDRENHNLTNVCLAPVNADGNKFLLARLDSLAEQGKRILVYNSNIEKLHALSEKYKCRQAELEIKVSFICSEKNERFSRYSDKEALDRLIETRHIDAHLLFITSALNSGVSIDEDFEYLFILGNPSQTDIFQLVSRIRKGKANRKLKTVYCSVPKYHSLKCRLDGLELALSYLNNPVEWQRKTHSNSFPPFMQMQYSYVYDDSGKPKYTPEGNPETVYQRDINLMALGKYKQDIKELRAILRYGSVLEAYKQLFIDRYKNITVFTLKEELETQGVGELVCQLKEYRSLEFLDKEQQALLKTICSEHGLPVSIDKINKLLAKHGYSLQLFSRQKKRHSQKIQAWYVEGYEFC